MDTSVIESLVERSKEFDFLALTYEPSFNDQLDAINIVKEFIIKHNLIVYGGSAIDMALRLCGDKIYPDDMLTIPDLDCYSPDNIKQSYDLADILYKRGYVTARAINGMHTETQRVDLGGNHFLADISYRPAGIFSQLPYLVYDGMRIINPLFQRIDVHSALSFPYDSPPLEVIFARWTNDCVRFNKLDQYYPIVTSPDRVPLRAVTVDIKRKYVYSGFAAYAIIYASVGKSVQAKFDSEVIDPKWAYDGNSMTFNTYDQTVNIVHFNINKGAAEYGLKKIHAFEPLINLMSYRIEGMINDGKIKVIFESTKNRLLCVNEVNLTADIIIKGGVSISKGVTSPSDTTNTTVDKSMIRVVNVQYLLKYFLSMYFVYGGEKGPTPKLAAVYLAHYSSLMHMIAAAESVATSIEDNTQILSSPLFLTVNTYGSENMNLAQEISLNRLYNELDGVKRFITPKNYTPAISIARDKPVPTFNYDDLKFFREMGNEIPLEELI